MSEMFGLPADFHAVSLTDLFAARGDQRISFESFGSTDVPAFEAIRKLAVANLDDVPLAAGRAFQASNARPQPKADVIDTAELEAMAAAAAQAETIQTARTEGYEQGHADAMAASKQAVEAIVAECRALIRNLDDARAIDRAALGPMLKNAVLDLVTQIVEAHVAADSAFVNACVGNALSSMKEAHEAARLYLHPDDIANVGDGATEGYTHIAIAADDSLPRGSVRLETGGGEIEDGVRPRLARLEQALRAAGLAA